jgi:hypothetical protein
MLDWLKKLSGIQKPLANPKNVPDELLELLAEDFASLNSLEKGMGQRILRYVVADEDEEVLLKLSGLEGAADALGVVFHIQRSPDFDKKRSKPREKLFEDFRALNPEVAYRLARVLHAAHDSTLSKAGVSSGSSSAGWLDVLLPEILGMGVWGLRSQSVKLDWPHLASVLEAGGSTRGRLAELTLTDSNLSSLGNYILRSLHPGMIGMNEYFASEPETVAKALRGAGAGLREAQLTILRQIDMPLKGPVLDAAMECANGPKAVRSALESWFQAQKDDAKAEIVTLLQTRATQGSATERSRALELLFKLQREECRPFLEERRQVEKTGSIIALIERYLDIHAAQEKADEASGEDVFVFPEPKSYPSQWKMPAEVERDLLAAFERYNAKAIEAQAKWWDRLRPEWRHGSRDIPPPVSPKKAKLVCRAMEDPALVAKLTLRQQDLQHAHLLHRELSEFAARNDLDLVPMICLGCCVGLVQKSLNEDNYFRYNPISPEFMSWLKQYRRRKEPDMTLLDLASALRSAGLNESWVTGMYMSPWFVDIANPLGLEDDAVWPFFYKYPVSLEEALGISGKSESIPSYRAGDYRRKVYGILATFPRPPKQFLPHLWEQALGTARTDRAPAQQCLKNVPGRDEFIVKALSDGRKEVRANAATWLSELKVASAADAVRQALAKEKHDEVKAALMGALESFGEDIDKFLNRKKLLEEAQKGLEKEIPSDLTWFPFDRLPVLHWEKNKQQVPPEIIKWFIVQSFRLKSPEPGSLLRRYFALMRPDERKVLGKFVLDNWLAQDTKPKYNRQEAEQLADQYVAQVKQNMARWPDYYKDFDELQARNAAVQRYLTECFGSANSSKGILAVAGACCGVEAVPPVERYLKQWYGQRAAQCKALLQMLSWVEHPVAIQLILSVGTRFRTKSIQKEAAVYADRIAERNEWTRDEMADRTVPTAGFERDGTQVIDYGERQFVARLLEDFSIQLETRDGKAIRDLPAANKTEDEAEIKALKAEFTASKKELKQVLKFQQERLYEAMCAQRSWRYEDWDLYLHGHPIVGRFSQRLVWLAYRGDRLVASFRPLGDGTLTDNEDNEVKLKADDGIRLAHGALLPEAEGAKWLRSLKDYEVEPLFEQFGGKNFALDEEGGRKTELTDFEGHMLGSFKLRSRATKLGYTRGQAEDGGWFYTYHKTFPSLKIQAVIEFTGNVLPEEERTVALRALRFTTLQDNAQDNYGYSDHPLPLGEVPGVLVSEAWNDMKKMADDGTGFEPEWEKKSEY